MDYLEFQALRRSEELYHHGIEGQKWGVRRFQNDDGSLTPAGRERYYGNGSGTRGIQRQRAGSVRRMEKKISRIDNQIQKINNSGSTKEKTQKAALEKLNEQKQRAELTNEYRQKVLDVKASKTAGGRFVNYFFGGVGGNLAISSMELKGNSRVESVGKEYVANILATTLTGLGSVVVNPIIYTRNRNEYIDEKMNKK